MGAVHQLFLYLANVFSHWVASFGGVALLVFEIWRKAKGKEAHHRIFWGAAAVPLAIGMYQAWLDEHRNSEVLISEKASVWGQYNECQGNLKAEHTKSDLLDNQNRAQQTTITGGKRRLIHSKLR